jgi:undecaprenyl-diphosphatase
MQILNAIFQGIIQGITEFLPVSSSGHLSIYQYFFQKGGGESFFSVMLHIGTLIAVFIAFRKEIWEYIKNFCLIVKDIFTGKFSYKSLSTEKKNVLMIFVALIPLLIVYPFKDKLEAIAENNTIWEEGIFFLITATVLFIASRIAKKESDREDITVKMALIIGIAQAVAVLPGISRSGSTIAVALILGLSKKSAFDFSFILGIPAVLGAALLDILDVVKGNLQPDVPILSVVIGIIVSAVVGIFAIKALRYILVKDKFQLFSYYTAFVGLFCILGPFIYHAVTA